MSKKAETGTVPELRFADFRKRSGWEEVPFDRVVTIHKGKGIAKADISQTGKLPCIRYGELYTRYGEVIDEVFSRTDVEPDELFLSEAGDVIIPASGETKEDIATAACVLREGVALGSDLNVLRSDADGAFLSYYINHSKKRAIANVAQGDAVVHLYPHQLNKLTLTIPKPDEQQKIAACLSSVDALLAAEREKLEALRAHKKGLMQQLFPAEGAKVPVLRFPGFGGEWEEKPLGSYTTIVRGGSPRPIDDFFTADEDGLNWLKIGDVDKEAKYVTRIQQRVLHTALSKTRVVAPGDLIMSNSMSFGRPYIMRMHSCIHDGWIAVTEIITKIDTEFLYYLISSDRSQTYFSNAAAGGGVKNLNADIIKVLPTLVPKDTKEQQAIAVCLSALDEHVALQAERTEVLEQHKKGLMQGLFPTNQS
jgi:type I restriction enzyme S subunit